MKPKLITRNIINLWGTGKPKREIIYVDDLAEAIIFFLKKKIKHNLINISHSKIFIKK